MQDRDFSFHDEKDVSVFSNNPFDDLLDLGEGFDHITSILIDEGDVTALRDAANLIVSFVRQADENGSIEYTGPSDY